MAKLTDESPMPQHGKFKGRRMEEVPAWYLLWLDEQPHCMKVVKAYIAENRDVLIEEQKRENKDKWEDLF